MLELALNLAWLTLLIPACLLWQRRQEDTRSARVILTLACLLLLLFPVISLSDDLSVMRAEMEDAAGPERVQAGFAGKHDGVVRVVPVGGFIVPAIGDATQSLCYEGIEARPAIIHLSPAPAVAAARPPPTIA